MCNRVIYNALNTDVVSCTALGSPNEWMCV